MSPAGIWLAIAAITLSALGTRTALLCIGAGVLLGCLLVAIVWAPFP